MSLVRLSLVSVVWLVATGCAQQPAVKADQGAVAPTDKLWWSPLLTLASTGDIPAALTSPFETPMDVTATSPTARVPQAVMTNCESFFALRSQGYEPRSENDSAAMKIEGARCQALKAVRTAPLVSRQPPITLSFSANALTVLPPELGPGPSPGERTRRQDATRQGISWQACDPQAKIAALHPKNAVVTGPDWTTKLEVLARGDFTGDGLTDILLRTVSYGEGSWREVRLRVLSQAGKDDGNKPVLAIKSELPL